MINKSPSDVYKKLFIYTTIPFGACMGICVGLVGGWQAGIIGGALAGLFYGISMAGILGVLNHFSTKKLQPDYGETLLGVHQVQALVITQPISEAFPTCVAALQAAGCVVSDQDLDLGMIQGQIGASWKSFGEKIMLTVSPADENSCTVTISSKPAITTTLVDYGKNLENVRAIVAQLSMRATTALPERRE